ncbi:hypothetical protein M0805_007322 [Coniferiporia weirii]|nr:hypothetical protein M0805_007322 [Coniferiporia weirii]
MPFSVDDLVSSFSSNHIGQEAIDIATLQAQLAQSLAYSQQHQQSTSGHGHCNTPTARTPTMSFANWSVLEQRRGRSSSSASTASRRGTLTNLESDMIVEENMDADDEYAVEQLVGTSSHASSPVRYRERNDALYTQNQSYANNFHTIQNQHQTRYPYPSADSFCECVSNPSSNFASSDPFFLAAEAQTRQAHQAAQNSFFAQIGRPAQHSPFYAAHTA